MDPLVSGAWLEKELGAPDLRLLDCTVVTEVLSDGSRSYRTGRPTWEQAHIPGSSHVDLTEEISDRSSPLPFMLPPADQFRAVMSRLGVGDGSRVVVYDSLMNVWAARVWWMLRAFGFDDAAVLDGGWRAWMADGRPVATDPEAPPAPATFVARIRPGLFVDKAEVLAAIGQPKVCIVHALSREVHSGERQDYPRPGHIPGDRNVPFAELVDPHTHRYLPEEELSAAFSGVLSAGPERVITYCGGGIAASSDAFALGLLGVEDVAVYDGSLSEWAADPSLPLVPTTEDRLLPRLAGRRRRRHRPQTAPVHPDPISANSKPPTGRLSIARCVVRARHSPEAHTGQWHQARSVSQE